MSGKTGNTQKKTPAPGALEQGFVCAFVTL